jgi:hypothetical protein
MSTDPGEARVITDPAVYQEAIGSEFTASQPAVALRLEEVKLVRDTAEQLSFILFLQGPEAPVLQQDSYRLAHPKLGACEIFLAPLRRSGASVIYQACFNLLKTPAA